jgi:hypothetical protein
MATNLRLTRDQLASFLPDHEAIRKFEKLLSIVDALSSQETDVVISAENAMAAASANAGAIAQVAQDAAINASEADRKATQAIDILSRVAQDATINASEADRKATEALDSLYKSLGLLDMVALAPPMPERTPTRYGAFYDTSTQTPALVNTAYAITLNTTDVSLGVYRGATTSQVFVTEAGVYNIAFSAQLDNTSGGSHVIYIWLRVNGADVANSASQVRLKGTDGELVAAWSFMQTLKAGDYIEIIYSASDTSVQILAQAAAAPVPGIPSMILTVAQIK